MRLVDEEMDRVAHEQFRKLETIHSEPDDLVNRHQYDRIQPPTSTTHRPKTSFQSGVTQSHSLEARLIPSRARPAHSCPSSTKLALPLANTRAYYDLP